MRDNITFIVLNIFVIPIVVNGMFTYLRRAKKAEKGKVYLHKFFVILGTIGYITFLISSIITLFLDEPIWVPIVSFMFSLLGATLIIAFVNCRISYDEEGFVYKNFFGIRRKYTYDQVTAIKEGVHEKYIYIGKRRVMVDEFSVGGLDFIKLVKEKYKTLHNGQNLPQVHKTKRDIFNGNVKDAGGFLIVYTMISICAIGFLIYVVNFVCFSPSNISNTFKQSLSFRSCDVKKDEIILKSKYNRIYKIRFIDEHFDAEDIKSICDGKKVVTTYSEKVTPDDEDDYYAVKAIVYNDNYLLTFEETNRLHSQEYWLLIVIAVAMCLIWGAYVVTSIIVGRNPKKYSERVIRFFFKDGYIIET